MGLYHNFKQKEIKILRGKENCFWLLLVCDKNEI